MITYNHLKEGLNRHNRERKELLGSERFINKDCVYKGMTTNTPECRYPYNITVQDNGMNLYEMSYKEFKLTSKHSYSYPREKVIRFMERQMKELSRRGL